MQTYLQSSSHVQRVIRRAKGNSEVEHGLEVHFDTQDWKSEALSPDEASTVDKSSNGRRKFMVVWHATFYCKQPHCFLNENMICLRYYIVHLLTNIYLRQFFLHRIWYRGSVDYYVKCWCHDCHGGTPNNSCSYHSRRVLSLPSTSPSSSLLDLIRRIRRLRVDWSNVINKTALTGPLSLMSGSIHPVRESGFEYRVKSSCSCWTKSRERVG